MRSALSSARMVRVLALALPCLSPLVSGCDNEAYPPDLTYPLRSDPIVVKQPKTEVWDTTRPGQLDLHIATFKDKEETLDPKKLSAKDRDDLDKALRDIFGTPADPAVKLQGEDVQQQLKDLRLDEAKDPKTGKTTLQEGSRVYRRHCMHCHGVTGDGRGPTGPWVNPHPRDYRQGKFKFVSTDADGRKPRREDIHRTLERGIEGTSMPSFSLLTEDEKEQLISYVTHLSIRGEVEMTTIMSLLNQEPLEDDSIRANTRMLTRLFVGKWSNSNTRVLEPGAYPYDPDDKEQLKESITRGYKLFTDTQGDASCIKCHADFGRQVPFRYDEWGTLIRPANLTAGVYRGGRRPIDLYWRVKGGIPPSGMPGANLNVDEKAKTDQYWDLVNFLQALPYPQMLPTEIRDAIYTHKHNDKSAEHAQR
ncbi:MAG TPA: c-type cytochrome [Gemmataceae bacterium]